MKVVALCAEVRTMLITTQVNEELMSPTNLALFRSFSSYTQVHSATLAIHKICVNVGVGSRI